VCVHCHATFFADTTDQTSMMHTGSDLLLLLAAMSRLRIWFDHGQRNRICVFLRILFYRFGLLLLLLLLLPCKHLRRLASLVEDVGCPQAIVLALAVSAVSLAQIHVLVVAVLAFPFPVGQHCARHHYHWCHWLHCHCSSCLFQLLRLRG